MAYALHDAYIVIVDDHAANVELLQQLLEDHGYTNTVGITDSRQLLPLLQQQPADLLLLDYRMPHLDGQQVVQQLQHALDVMPAIIVLTAQTDQDTRHTMLALGVDDFLVKPFDHAEVLQRMQNTLELHAELCDQRKESRTLAATVKDRNAQLERLSHIDPVTELPNRRALLEQLELMKQHSRQVTVYYLVFDGLADLAALNGYQAADQLLCQMSQRLSQALSSMDCLAVWNSTEWVILQSGLASRDEVVAQVQRMLNIVQQPLLLDGGKYSLQLRMGVSYQEDDIANEEMIRHAALAVPLVAGCYRLFEPSIEQEFNRRQQLRHSLRHAIEQDELELLFQPKLCLHTGVIKGAEALLRWHSRDFGRVSPAEFIPLAESSGDIIELGDWVLAQGIERRLCWQEERKVADDWVLAINVAAAQLHDETFAERLIHRVRSGGLAPHTLEIEVTESGLMQDMGLAMAQLNYLHKAGIRIAIDDFGTGYSSLAYLKQLPVSVLKIDMAFIRELDINQQDQRLTSTVIDMAKHFQCVTVAEGIEKAEQLSLLQHMGCERGQGYLFAPPLQEEALLKLCAMRQPFEHLFHSS